MTTLFSLRNDAGATSSDAATKSLWQKFNMLQQSIEECIKERKETDAKIDASQMRQSDLRELRRDNLHESREAERKLNEIEGQIAALQNHYDEEIQPAYASALLDKRSAEIKLKEWKEYKASALQLFLERSAKFRVDCKRLQMTSEAVGLSHAKAQSWTYIISCERGADMVGFAFDDLNEQVHPICPNDDNAASDDPLLWSIPKNDYELLEFIEKYKREWEAYEIFRKELDILKTDKADCLQHELSLTERASLMQKQLNRILNDCNDLESQMTDQRDTTMRQGQAPIVLSDAGRQHDAFSEERYTKRARTSNPYVQNKAKRSRDSASKRKMALQSVVLGSTAFDGRPVSSPFRPDDSPAQKFDFSRFRHDQVECSADDEKQTNHKDGSIFSNGSQSRSALPMDDDDDEDDLLRSSVSASRAENCF